MKHFWIAKILHNKNADDTKRFVENLVLCLKPQCEEFPFNLYIVCHGILSLQFFVANLNVNAGACTNACASSSKNTQPMAIKGPVGNLATLKN